MRNCLHMVEEGVHYRDNMCGESSGGPGAQLSKLPPNKYGFITAVLRSCTTFKALVHDSIL